MRRRIKLCGVRTVADALLCAAAGADEIGVILAPRSKRRISLEEARRIREALPPELPLVGVFADATLDEIESTARAVGLAAAQLHGKFISQPASLPLYAALQVTGPIGSVSPAGPIGPIPKGAARVLLDGPAGGSGISFAWSLAGSVRANYPGPLYVAGGLTAANVAQAIRESHPDGVDVASGIEGADGFKDPARVRAFVAAARAAFEEL